MARIVYSGLVQDMRGSVGGSTFSVWKGIHYLRNKAATIGNPQTMRQMAVRQSFATAVRNWGGLSAVDKAKWEEWAQSLKVAGAKDEVVGDMGIIPHMGRTQSGMNAYIGTAQVLFGAGYPAVSKPPVQPQPYPTRFLSVIWQPAPESRINISFTSTENPEILGRKLVMWEKGYWQGSHSYITTKVDVPEPPVVPPELLITTVRMGWGNNIQDIPISTLVPCTILIQGIITRVDGYRSTPTALFSVSCVG